MSITFIGIPLQIFEHVLQGNSVTKVLYYPQQFFTTSTRPFISHNIVTVTFDWLLVHALVFNTHKHSRSTAMVASTLFV